MSEPTIQIAEAYLVDARNDTDHANELVRDAQVILDSDDVAKALERLRLALTPAERAPGRIRGTIEYLERLQQEGT